jgi:hypothetical protein
MQHQRLSGLIASFAALAVFFNANAQADTALATLTLHPNTVTASIPEDFIGLSYESLQLSNPEFFSPSNKPLIGLFRRLAKHGILRIGGNTSEYTRWDAAGAESTTIIADADKGGGKIPTTTITPKTLRNLDGFLKATGWKLVYGLNLGTGTPAEAAEEAEAVVKIMGPDLVALQVGNEPDLFSSNGLRGKDYGFDDFYKEWIAFDSAIKTRVPAAPIAGPDTCWDWVPNFVARIKKSDVLFLSSHFYWTGPPPDPKVTIDSILNGSGWFDYNIKRDTDAAKQIGLPYRNTESNSCYRGGKPGVSDTFASALWSGEFCLLNGSWGAAGVTFHGGGKAVYTPIAGDLKAGFTARPDYYGILLASQFLGSQLIASDLNAAGANLKAYAAIKGRGAVVAIFNNDKDKDADVSINTKVKTASIWRLTAPALDAKTDVTLADAQVSDDGSWKPGNVEMAFASNGQLVVNVPAGSAVLVFLE